LSFDDYSTVVDSVRWKMRGQNELGQENPIRRKTDKKLFKNKKKKKNIKEEEHND